MLDHASLSNANRNGTQQASNINKVSVLMILSVVISAKGPKDCCPFSLDADRKVCSRFIITLSDRLTLGQSTDSIEAS